MEFTMGNVDKLQADVRRLTSENHTWRANACQLESRNATLAAEVEVLRKAVAYWVNQYDEAYQRLKQLELERAKA